MLKVTIARLVCVGALAVGPAVGHALTGITDNPNDILPTFGGNPAASAGLDVISATVLYDAATDLYRLTGTMHGAIGSSPTSLYVWGVNRGAGTPGFLANGIDGVRFDRVIVLNAGGTGTVPGVGDLPAGSVTIGGDTISAVVSGSLLASTGFNKLDYTWNLWPRNGTFAGFAQIADFAPDNANFTATPGIVAVPEPGTYLMMLAGLGLIVLVTQRRAGPRLAA